VFKLEFTPGESFKITKVTLAQIGIDQVGEHWLVSQGQSICARVGSL
jgi:hypothetical protein